MNNFEISRVDGPLKPDYGAHYPLGEKDWRLKGIVLDVSTNIAKLVHLSVSEKADGPMANKLRAEMVNSGQFYQGGSEGMNEFIYVGNKTPHDAIQQIMSSEKMEKFSETRREAMEKAEAKRLEDLQRSNDAAWEATKAASKKQAEDLTRAQENLKKIEY